MAIAEVDPLRVEMRRREVDRLMYGDESDQ
jgi:hypothetical protein